MDYYFYYKSWDFIHRITKCEFNRRMFDLLIKKLNKNINNIPIEFMNLLKTY